MLVCQNIDELFELPITENQIAASHACTCNPHFPPHPKDWYVASMSNTLSFTCISSKLNHHRRYPQYCAFAQLNYPKDIQYPKAVLTGPTSRSYKFLNGGMFVFRPSGELLGRITKMLDNTPIIQSWRFCEQNLLTVFFGGGGEKSEDWGIKKEELGDLWMGIPYYYNALITMRYTYLPYGYFPIFTL